MTADAAMSGSGIGLICGVAVMCGQCIYRLGALLDLTLLEQGSELCKANGREGCNCPADMPGAVGAKLARPLGRSAERAGRARLRCRRGTSPPAACSPRTAPPPGFRLGAAAGGCGGRASSLSARAQGVVQWGGEEGLRGAGQ